MEVNCTLELTQINCVCVVVCVCVLLGHEGSSLTAQSCWLGEQQLWTMQDVNQYRELCLHQWTELIL